MDVAYGLSFLVACKLVVYTFGTLIHLFLLVLILGNWRLRRLQWLLFGLMAALFMWYSGNLLALNIDLYYGAGPAIMSAFARTVSVAGFMGAVPLLVHVQVEYVRVLLPVRVWQRLVVACFYLPAMLLPWTAAKLVERLGVEPLVALGWMVLPLALWAIAGLVFAATLNIYLTTHQSAADPALARLYGYLAALQALLGVGWAIALVPLHASRLGGLGGYFATGLMLAGMLPSGLLGYSIFRHNVLEVRVQRNVVYAVAAIFGSLIYLDFMRRVSGWLEPYDILREVTEAGMIFILVVLVEPLKRLISRGLHRQFVSEYGKVQTLVMEIEDHAKRTGDVTSLRALVEERVPQVLGLEKARLVSGPLSPDPSRGEVAPNVRRVAISGGGETTAYLEVATASGGVSGEQMAALEILAGRLAAALELCRLIADKINLERELAARERMAFLGEMAARIAHNVKNPLSGMKTIVQLLEEDKTLPENARRDCRMLSDEIDRLNRNISQVLRYAKPARDAGQAADLASVVRRVVAISRLDAEQHHVALEVSGPPTALIQGGEEAAADIVSNLLVNALEASGEGSAIRVEFAQPARHPECVQLAIEDQGRGIAKDKFERIFQPFFTTKPGGTGLGLAIVKRRLDEVGGTVDCQSPVAESGAAGDHPGTRFVVRFRAAPTDGKARQAHRLGEAFESR